MQKLHFEYGWATVILWQGELGYSRVLKLSWFGCHLFFIVFFLWIGTGYRELDYIGIVFLVIILLWLNSKINLMYTGRLVWYKALNGHYYVLYQDSHYRLRRYPYHFYHIIVFERTVNNRKLVPYILITPDSLSHQSWRKLACVLAYYRLLNKFNRHTRNR